MPSTLVSNHSKDNVPIVDVQNLSLTFKVNTIKHSTLRDQFIQSIKHPVEWLLKEPDRLAILKEISFKLYKGERVGLIGINGTGKTTLCRCLANIYRPTLGKIKTPIETRAVFNTAVGIYPELTGRENAEILYEFLFPNLGLEKKDIIEDALNFSELGDFLDVPFKFYSNGMQARLCLSLISARPSELLILDEVFDGADQFFRKKISVRVKNMIEKSGAVVFVSHSNEQILEVCNRVIILSNGRIVFDGQPQEGIEKYSASSIQN